MKTKCYDNTTDKTGGVHGPTVDDLPSSPESYTGWPWTQSPFPCSLDEALNNALPRITIVTPSYNQGEFIESTIRSVLLQGYPNLEYIVVDGGSTDDTLSILRKYDQWITSWVSESDRGQSHAINKGFAKATGEIFGWLNSDDLLCPCALQAIARASLQHPEAVAWVGKCRKVDSGRNHLETVEPHGLSEKEMGDWWYRGHFYQPSCLFDAETFRSVGRLNESLHYAMDVDLWMRLAKKGAFVPVNDVLSEARIYEEAKTWSAPDRVEAEKIAINVFNEHADIAERRLKRHVKSEMQNLSIRRILNILQRRVEVRAKSILRSALAYSTE